MTTQEKLAWREAALTYLRDHGRPIEQAQAAMLFGKGAAADVIEALQAYQNSDGGFGNGLEPDIRLADSSAYATTIALQVLRRIGLKADHPMVKSAMGYLMASFDPDKGGWVAVPANVSDAPHAPWWRYSDDVDAQWANPRAEIVGYMLDYCGADDLETAMGLFKDTLRRLDTATQVEMHDLQCLVRLAETAALPTDARDALSTRLVALAPTAVGLKPSDWEGYSLQPLDIAAQETSPLRELCQPTLPNNVQHLLARQADNGSWSPPWGWGEGLWPVVEAEWKSYLTFINLTRLEAQRRQRTG